ncbi:hypothetical protein HFO61_31620 [Rhizobium leguminosarum]|uniref:hypothetical protein n=1 Tax=Rhizobium leguminosarum TaxID=384 RepID=UPI001C9810B1|nr:hypothetical protein [Rhizobium leguminosarum]MBY5551289.1 hypothetical protein [Rhizobium leguminosarum]
MGPELSLLIDELTAAKAITEKNGRRRMLAYLLELAIVDAEEERERQHANHTDRSVN